MTSLETHEPIRCHASAIALPQGGVLLLGDSGSGKSSLAYRLLRHYGGQLVGDDYVDIALTKGRLTAHSVATLAGLLNCAASALCGGRILTARCWIWRFN